MRNEGPPTHGATLCKRASERNAPPVREPDGVVRDTWLVFQGPLGCRLRHLHTQVGEKRNEKKKKKPLGWRKEAVMTHGTTSTYEKNQQM